MFIGASSADIRQHRALDLDAVVEGANAAAPALALPLNGNFTVSKAEFGKTDPAHLNDFVFDLKSPCSPGCRCPDGNCVPCCTSVHHCCPRLDGVPLGNISSMEPFSNSSDPSPLPSASP